MSRRGKKFERKLVPDPAYHDVLVTEFVNCVMRKGKKSIAEGIFYGAMDMIGGRVKDEPIEVVKKAIKNASPMLEVKSRRVGGANYQVPIEVSARRQQSLAIRWLVQYARERSEHTMAERIAMEIMDAADNKGNAIKKRDDIHRMAEANRAFAHYRW